MQINPHAQVVTCQYCRLSSFVHLPHRRDPRRDAGQAGYGHIHVQADALRKAGLLVAATALVPIAVVVIVGVVMTLVVMGIVVATVVSSAPSRPRPSPVPVPAPMPAPAPPSQGGTTVSCERAVACCKVVVGAGTGDPAMQRSCEALRALSDSDCERQLESFRGSAQSLGRQCP
jgi:hypothetical protein